MVQVWRPGTGGTGVGGGVVVPLRGRRSLNNACVLCPFAGSSVRLTSGTLPVVGVTSCRERSTGLGVAAGMISYCGCAGGGATLLETCQRIIGPAGGVVEFVRVHTAHAWYVMQVYTELRREAGMTHAMPVAVRHLESMIRMSEAHARMHLRDKVEPQDIDIAIRLMLESFIQVQPRLCRCCVPLGVGQPCRPDGKDKRIVLGFVLGVLCIIADSRVQDARTWERCPPPSRPCLLRVP